MARRSRRVSVSAIRKSAARPPSLPSPTRGEEGALPALADKQAAPAPTADSSSFRGAPHRRARRLDGRRRYRRGRDRHPRRRPALGADRKAARRLHDREFGFHARHRRGAFAMIFGKGADDIDVTASALAREFAETAGEYDRTAAFPFANIERLRETRLAALIVPREYGGRGAGLMRANRVVNAIARGEASTGLVLAQQYLFHGTLRSNAVRNDPAVIEAYLGHSEIGRTAERREEAES